MHKRRFRPSPAMVVSLIALFVALGGTSYAAINALPKNSVGTKQIKNGAVTAAKISRSSLPPAKVVGAPGAPAYAGTWKAAPNGDDEVVSFYKDPWGIVHLQGNAYNPNTVNGTIFTLPPGYRPKGEIYFAAYGSNGSAALVAVYSNGNVDEFGAPRSYVGLSNITFRAGL
jgi:hypothetical protein